VVCHHFNGQTIGDEIAVDITLTQLTSGVSDLVVVKDVEVTELTELKETMNDKVKTMDLLTQINKWILKYKLIILFLCAITPIVIEGLPSLGRPLSLVVSRSW